MLVDQTAPGRLATAPVAIVDIGSNSVRLVAYECLSRALTPLFNEKVLCGLGRGVATTGLLAPDAMEKALGALRCFRALCRNMGITDVQVLATAATRDASNGPEFLKQAREAIGTDIALIGGLREAELSAKGVISGFFAPDGIVGDLGGGSLELVDVRGLAIGSGVSLKIGGLALSDLSKESPKRAVRIVREAFVDALPLKALKGRSFYAVGGTFRALAKLHMTRRQYPLAVMQGYVIPSQDPEVFGDLVENASGEVAASLASVAGARRPLLAYGAVILEEVIRQGRPKDIVISTLGVREGVLYERLSAAERAADPLLLAASQLNVLRSRSPGHGEDLRAWSDALFESAAVEETVDQRRMRHAACLLSDVSWRAHPDYRSAEALNTIANAAFVGVDHADRAFLALTINYRYEGLDRDSPSKLRDLVGVPAADRAKLIAGIMRVAFQLSAATGGVLATIPLRCIRSRLVLDLPAGTAALASARLQNRFRQLARLLNREPEIKGA